MFDSVGRYTEQQQNNLGYVLGWFCGGILIFGVIVSAVNLFQGHRRQAFQAIILPVGVIAWAFLIMDGLSSILPNTDSGAVIGVLFLLGGIIFIPLIGLRFLRGLTWPARVETGSE